MNESPEFEALFGWRAVYFPGLGWRQGVPRRYWDRAFGVEYATLMRERRR